MGQQFKLVQGIDFTLPQGPPLTDPPLSLLSESHTLLDLEGKVAQRQQAVDKAASAAQQLEDLDANGTVGDDDLPGKLDSLEDAKKALQQQVNEWQDRIASLDSELKELQRWEHGIEYLPELDNPEAMTVWAPDVDPAISNPLVTSTKETGINQDLFYWYDPFVVVGLDSRSSFGWPATDFDARAMRAIRALRGHESWQCENEFWSGVQVPTNWHLTASPDSPVTSPHRTLVVPFANPTPTPGTVLGTAASLSVSLASLDQAIADSDAGTGFIHATPYVQQQWSKAFPFLRDPQGFVRTVNNNILVPGYGYGGTGPDQADRSASDGVTTTTTTFTSSSGAFTTFDLGHQLSDTSGALHSQRTVTDGSFTAGATAFRSYQANFTSADEGVEVSGFGLAPGTTIATVTNGYLAVLTQKALTTVTGATIAIDTDTYIVGITSSTEAVMSQLPVGEATDIDWTLTGTGGRATGAAQQWAYATDAVYHCNGDIHTYPRDLREESPALPTFNYAEIRAERSHALITNQLVRAAVLVDTAVV